MEVQRTVGVASATALLVASAFASAFAQTAETKQLFINQTDLATLGCEVKSDSGIFIQRMGEKILSFSDKASCAREVSTSVIALKLSKANAAEQWASIQDGVARRARKCKCEAVTRKGSIGERSEIFEFAGQNKHTGYEYIVQDRDVLYHVAVYAGSPAMDPELERIVAGKIDKVVAHIAGG